MERKSHTNPAKPCQITPQLPFAVEPYHDLLTPAQERALAPLLEARSVAPPPVRPASPSALMHRWLRHDQHFFVCGVTSRFSPHHRIA
jgi:hypothetical protein